MSDLSMVEAGLDEIVGSISIAVFGSESQRTSSRELVSKDRWITGVVTIAGGWNGAVSITCSPGLAMFAAGAMFGRNARALTSEDVHDAIGELANMVGGNLKSLVNGDDPLCVLSMPIVVDGEIAVPGTEVQRNWFDLAGEWMCVTVFEEQRVS